MRAGGQPLPSQLGFPALHDFPKGSSSSMPSPRSRCRILLAAALPVFPSGQRLHVCVAVISTTELPEAPRAPPGIWRMRNKCFLPHLDCESVTLLALYPSEFFQSFLRFPQTFLPFPVPSISKRRLLRQMHLRC